MGLAVMLTLVLGGVGAFVGGIVALGSLALGPAVAVVVTLRQVRELEDLPDNLLYANTAVTAAAGTVVKILLIGLFLTIGGNSSGGGGSVGGGPIGGGTPGLGQLLVPLILIAIGAAVAAAVTAWAARNITPGPAPMRQPAQAARGAPQGGAPNGGTRPPAQGAQGGAPQRSQQGGNPGE
jgi:hypothetical protein